MASSNAKKEAAWKIFALLGAIVVVVAYAFLFVPDFRTMIGLSAKPSGLRLIGGGKAPAGNTRGPAAIPKDELESFCDSFTSIEVDIFIIPEDEVVEVGISDDERTQVLDSLWEVRVNGSFPDLEKNWQAIIQGQYCKVGRRIESRVEGRCAYQILKVGRTCVWMVAYQKEYGVPKFHEVEWPDVSFIVNDHVNGRLQPARIRFARGTEVGPDRPFKISRSSNVVFRIVKLFDHGVCFEASEGDQSWFFACMVVAP